jgi:hypothetical protein
MEKISLKMIGDNTDCYIHFTNKEKLEYFINKYKYKSKLIIGHMCCSGKGCHIKSFEGKEITDYDQINDIHKKHILSKTYT